VSVTFKTTIVWDKNGQTRLQMVNVFKYALNVKIDYIAVMAETDRLDYFFLYKYSINIHLLKYFVYCTLKNASSSVKINKLVEFQNN